MPVTPNYNLNLPQGTDLISPLSAISNAMTTIDTTLKTHKDLTDKAVTTTRAQKRTYVQVYAGGVVTDVSGLATLAHTAGFTPTVVQIIGNVPASSFGLCIGTDNYTGAAFRGRWFRWDSGAAYTSTNTGAFTAIFWE